MRDRLIIQDLEASCRLGVFEWEQRQPQTVWIDLELAVDASRAAASDSVEDAVDYARLAEEVKRLAEGRPYRLMETLAQALASLVLERFGTRRVRVRVKNRALKGIGYAAVEGERAVHLGRVARPSTRPHGLARDSAPRPAAGGLRRSRRNSPFPTTSPQ